MFGRHRFKRSSPEIHQNVDAPEGFESLMNTFFALGFNGNIADVTMNFDPEIFDLVDHLGHRIARKTRDKNIATLLRESKSDRFTDSVCTSGDDRAFAFKPLSE